MSTDTEVAPLVELIRLSLVKPLAVNESLSVSTKAFLKMKKFDIAELVRVYEL